MPRNLPNPNTWDIINNPSLSADGLPLRLSVRFSERILFSNCHLLRRSHLPKRQFQNNDNNLEENLINPFALKIMNVFRPVKTEPF